MKTVSPSHAYSKATLNYSSYPANRNPDYIFNSNLIMSGVANDTLMAARVVARIVS